MSEGQRIAQNVQLVVAIKQWELSGRTESPAVMDKKQKERIEKRWDEYSRRTSSQKHGFCF